MLFYKEIICINLRPIAEAWDQIAPKEAWWEMAFDSRIPGRSVWVEWIGTVSRPIFTGPNFRFPVRPTQIGMLMTMARGHEINAQFGDVPEGAMYAVMVAIFTGDRRYAFTAPFGVYAYLRANGSLMWDESNIYYHQRLENEVLHIQDGTDHDTLIADFREIILYECAVGLYGLTLLNCKNVELVHEPVTQKPQKKKRRSVEQSERRERFHVLNLLLPGTIKRRQNDSGSRTDDETRIVMPWHRVIGHTADYREKGLFGKYKGIFWIPDHSRGSLEIGRVTKHYRLHVKPQESTNGPKI